MGLLGADEATLKRRAARPLEGAWREWSDTLSYGPRVQVLSLDEMDKVEAERERAARWAPFVILPGDFADCAFAGARNGTSCRDQERADEEGSAVLYISSLGHPALMEERI